MILKSLAIGVFLDEALKLVGKGLKALFGPLAKSLADKGTEKFAGKAVEWASEYVEKRHKDEYKLIHAEKLVSEVEIKGFDDNLALVAEFAKRSDGSVDETRAERFREFVRLMCVCDTVEETANTIRWLGSLNTEVCLSVYRSIDLAHKYEHRQLDAARKWLKEKQPKVAEAVGKSGKKVLSVLKQADANILQTATDWRSWADNYKARYTVPAGTEPEEEEEI